jgi:hypothetical protein
MRAGSARAARSTALPSSGKRNAGELSQEFRHPGGVLAGEVAPGAGAELRLPYRQGVSIQQLRRAPDQLGDQAIGQAGPDGVSLGQPHGQARGVRLPDAAHQLVAQARLSDPGLGDDDGHPGPWLFHALGPEVAQHRQLALPPHAGSGLAQQRPHALFRIALTPEHARAWLAGDGEPKLEQAGRQLVDPDGGRDPGRGRAIPGVHERHRPVDDLPHRQRAIQLAAARDQHDLEVGQRRAHHQGAARGAHHLVGCHVPARERRDHRSVLEAFHAAGDGLHDGTEPFEGDDRRVHGECLIDPSARDWCGEDDAHQPPLARGGREARRGGLLPRRRWLVLDGDGRELRRHRGRIGGPPSGVLPQ